MSYIIPPPKNKNIDLNQIINDDNESINDDNESINENDKSINEDDDFFQQLLQNDPLNNNELNKDFVNKKNNKESINNKLDKEIVNKEIVNKEINKESINNNNDEEASINKEKLINSEDVSQKNNFSQENIDNENEKEKNEKSSVKEYIYLSEESLENDIEAKHKDSILHLIFEGHTYTYITYHSHKLKLKSISVEDSEQAYKHASNYPDDQFYSMYQLLILSFALLEIDDYIFNSKDECLDFLYKLPFNDIVKIYTIYFTDVQNQNKLINQIPYFYDLVDEPFFRMKYKVMRAFSCLPTEDRCKKMNDAQWLWLYYNLEEDLFEQLDETQDNLDYIGFYINSDAAKKIVKHNQQRRKQRDKKRKQRFANIQSQQQQQQDKVNVKKGANQFLDNFFTDESQNTENSEVRYNSSFERELAAALGKDVDISEVLEFSDDKSAGDPMETEEEFLERVKAFFPVAGTSYGYTKAKKLKINPNAYRMSSVPRPDLQQGEYIPTENNQIDLDQFTNNNFANQEKLIDNYEAFAVNDNIDKKSNINVKEVQMDNKDAEFMRKMHINNLSDLEKFKNISPDTEKDLDFIIDDE